jgi:hypothetical protein
MTKYFTRRALKNSPFKYFEDITENQEIANIIWTDAKMIAAYALFGDVIIFDTTFGTNNEKWAFGVFVGFNHFREGILCWHALKVLDREDIKIIPPKYILNRWTQAAKDDTVVEIEGKRVIEDATLDIRNRNGDLIREIAPTCAKTTYDEEQT